jgi:hypothetical protein
MKKLLVMLSLVGLTGVALAEKPVFDEPTQPVDIQCDLTCVVYDWDFALGDHGFTTAACDTGGVPTWEYGATTYIPGAPGNVWATVLNDDYASNSGEGLVSPTFFVDESTSLMEIYHYWDIETNYDGCNVTVNGNVIHPMMSYSVAQLSTSTSYYAYCVDLEPGWTGHEEVWTHSCFDLSQFATHDIEVEFDFGSDRSVTYPGWYIAYVKIGSSNGSPVEVDTWGMIKGMFR